MKTSPLLHAGFLCALAISAIAQGDLNPTNPPGHTFKTLTEIEPRTAITTSGPFFINSPGSYYLTKNISVPSGNGITITVDNVTLDLNGFTISSTETPPAPPATTAISLGGAGTRTQVHIFNGHIRGQVSYNGETGVFSGAGFLNGISGAPANSVRVSGVSVRGCSGNGISLVAPLEEGQVNVVDSCTVKTAGGIGIFAEQVSRCVAKECGTGGIYAKVAMECSGQAHSGTGLSALTAHNCQGASRNGEGLVASSALNCHGISSTVTGLRADQAENCRGISGNSVGLSSGVALGCQGSSDSVIGLYATTAMNCSGVCLSGTESGTGFGILATMAMNCYGVCSSGTGTGLYATMAHHSYGATQLGTGIQALEIAMACTGRCNDASGTALLCGGTASYCTAWNFAVGGKAIQAQIGIGCVKFAGVNNITQPFLGTVSP